MSTPLDHAAGAALHAHLKSPNITTRAELRDTLRSIWGFARRQRARLAIFLSLIVVDAIIGAAVPLLYRAIIDRGILPGDTHLVALLAGGVAVLAIAAAPTSVTQRWMAATIGENLIFDLRNAVFAHLQKMPIAFFSRTQTGALVQRINGDVLGAQQALTSVLANVFSNICTLTFVLAAMFALSWQVTAAALVLVPALIVPVQLVARRLRHLTSTQLALNADMAQSMNERFNVGGAMVARLFEAPHRATTEFSHRSAAVRDVGIKLSLAATVFRVSLTLVAALAVALVYGVGGTLAISGTLAVGTRRPHRLPPTPLRATHRPIQRPSRCHDRHRQLRTRPRGPQPHPPRHRRTPRHRPRHHPHPGQVIAIVGHSGAGKSTLTNLIPRLYDTTTGQILVRGTDVRDLTQQSLRNDIGLVTQDPHLYHDTIRNRNLLLPRRRMSPSRVHLRPIPPIA